ncbi:hypothetical protein QFC24_002238 [Naganishia onofrii]|uniref:Uncharacterized protein n=1 Tax=Naganishia onofrii TaxID=1851511 RepID=A0ACC2XT12_9TREE|nr:hypothetical protein QFC24_002238 [Naganishia onofrii]
MLEVLKASVVSGINLAASAVTDFLAPKKVKVTSQVAGGVSTGDLQITSGQQASPTVPPIPPLNFTFILVPTTTATLLLAAEQHAQYQGLGHGERRTNSGHTQYDVVTISDDSEEEDDVKPRQSSSKKRAFGPLLGSGHSTPAREVDELATPSPSADINLLSSQLHGATPSPARSTRSTTSSRPKWNADPSDYWLADGEAIKVHLREVHQDDFTKGQKLARCHTCDKKLYSCQGYALHLGFSGVHQGASPSSTFDVSLVPDPNSVAISSSLGSPSYASINALAGPAPSSQNVPKLSSSFLKRKHQAPEITSSSSEKVKEKKAKKDRKGKGKATAEEIAQQ